MILELLVGIGIGVGLTYLWFRKFPVVKVVPDPVLDILIKNMSDSAVVLFDHKMIIQKAGGPLFKQKDPQHMTGVSLVQAFPEHLEHTRKYGHQILSGHLYKMDVVYKGSQYVVQGTPVVLTKQPMQGLITVTDVSVSRHRDVQAELQNKELERSNRDLAQFADVASHELKAPLRRISSFIDLLQMERADWSPEGLEYMAHINEGVSEMRSVLHALLVYSRVKLTENRMQRVDLNGIIERVLEGLSPRIEETGARINTGKLPSVTGDPELLKLLFKNLIWNGVKFTAACQIRPVITVLSVETDQPRGWKIDVQDNGLGIPADQKQEAFLMFRRMMPEVEGQGVGLALCKKIMGIHHGKITVTDRSDGLTGAVFSVYFPASTTGFQLL